MARITVEDCLTKETNRFALILLASKRTKQILNGAPVLLENVKNKAVVTALREIAAGKVRFMSEEDMAKKAAQEKAEREALLARKEANGSMNGDSGMSERKSDSEQTIDADSLFKTPSEVAAEAANESNDDDSSSEDEDSNSENEESNTASDESSDSDDGADDKLDS